MPILNDIHSSREVFQYLEEYKEYYKDDRLHGIMGSVISDACRTVYSMAIDDKFTIAMLRDLIYYTRDVSRTLCLVTDQSSEFDRLRTLLEQRYNFVCVINNNGINDSPVMYSFYFKT